MQKGTIKWFDNKRGFGFIDTGEGKDVYVHISSLSRSISRNLSEGDAVTFDVGNGKKGPMAVNVRLEARR